MTSKMIHVVRADQASHATTPTGWQKIFLGAHALTTSPLVMGLTHQRPYLRSPLICHETSEICFIVRGSGMMVTDEQEHYFEPGDALHIEPGCWHAIKTEAEEVEMVYVFPDSGLPATREWTEESEANQID